MPRYALLERNSRRRGELVLVAERHRSESCALRVRLARRPLNAEPTLPACGRIL